MPVFWKYQAKNDVSSYNYFEVLPEVLRGESKITLQAHVAARKLLDFYIIQALHLRKHLKEALV